MRVNGQSSRYFGRLGGKRQNWSVLYRLFICLKLKCPRKMRKKDTRHHESMLCSVNEACIEESNGRSPFTPNYTAQSTNNRSVGSCYIRLVLQSQTEQNSFRARWCFSDIAPRQKNVLPNREGYQCETRQRKLGTKYIGRVHKLYEMGSLPDPKWWIETTSKSCFSGRERESNRRKTVLITTLRKRNDFIM